MTSKTQTAPVEQKPIHPRVYLIGIALFMLLLNLAIVPASSQQLTVIIFSILAGAILMWVALEWRYGKVIVAAKKLAHVFAFEKNECCKPELQELSKRVILMWGDK